MNEVTLEKTERYPLPQAQLDGLLTDLAVFAGDQAHAVLSVKGHEDRDLRTLGMPARLDGDAPRSLTAEQIFGILG